MFLAISEKFASHCLLMNNYSDLNADVLTIIVINIFYLPTTDYSGNTKICHDI